MINRNIKQIVIDLVKSDKGAKSAKDKAHKSSLFSKLAADVNALKNKSKQIRKGAPAPRYPTRRER
jgi:hypothetical protein